MLQEMQSAGLRPNERTFSTLMRGCMRDARGDAAQVVLLQMQQNGVSPDGPCLEYAVKALVYDGELKAASKLCKLHARDITAAAAVVLATGWAVAGERKKAAKAAALAREKLAPGSDAKLNPFKKAEAGNSHEMYSVHQASELQVHPLKILIKSTEIDFDFTVRSQRDLERIDDEVKRIKSGVAGAEACKSMRRSPRVLFVRGGGSSTVLDRDHLLSRFPARLSAGELCIEAGSGYGEWVVSLAFVRCIVCLLN
jgi:pentatricopeptide repeat protein